jgi:hypothetical protein
MVENGCLSMLPSLDWEFAIGGPRQRLVGEFLFSHAVPATASHEYPEVHWGHALVRGTKPFNGMQAYGCS